MGFIALLLVGTHAQLYGASMLGGLVWAGSIALSSAILADVYGVRLVGVLYGLAYFVHQVGAMISSWLGGYAYEAWGTHWVAFGGAALYVYGTARTLAGRYLFPGVAGMLLTATGIAFVVRR